MRAIIALLFCGIIFMGVGAHAAQTCIETAKPGGNCCSLGMTKMSDDHTNIIACLLATGSAATDCKSGGGCYFKTTMNSTMACPYGVLIGFSNGQPQCAAVSPQVTVASCPAGTSFNGISHGQPVCTKVVSTDAKNTTTTK